MKKIVDCVCKNYVIFILYVMLFSCERRDLHYMKDNYIQVRINLAWTEGDEEPKYNKAIFYSKGTDSLLQEFYLSTNSEIVLVKPGEYDVIVYNYRTNLESQTCQFYQKKYFLEKIAYTSPQVNKLGVFDEFTVRYSPDMLYSWSASSIVIEEEESENANIQEISTSLSPMISVYNFHVDVVGLEYIRAISSIASGFSVYSTLVHQNTSKKPISHKLDMQMTKKGFQCSFSAFKHQQSLDQKLYFVIQLPDNSLLKIHRDLNSELDEKGVIEYVEPIIIKYDGPIEPPGEDTGGFNPPEIGDWVDVEEDIIM